MRDRTHDVVAAVYEVLAPAAQPSDSDLENTLDRDFTVRTGPDNAAGFGPTLLADIRRRAPRTRLTLAQEGNDALADFATG